MISANLLGLIDSVTFDNRDFNSMRAGFSTLRKPANNARSTIKDQAAMLKSIVANRNACKGAMVTVYLPTKGKPTTDPSKVFGQPHETVKVADLWDVYQADQGYEVYEVYSRAEGKTVCKGTVRDCVLYLTHLAS